MTLEAGLTPLGEGIQLFLEDLDLMDLDVGSGATFSLDVAGDEGIEGFETETEDTDSVYDGANLGMQRVAPKSITLPILLRSSSASEADRAAAIYTAMERLSLRLNPLPDRLGGLRMLRYRRNEGVAKRIYYRPANGSALVVPGNEQRVKFDAPDITVRLEGPEGIVWSDEYVDYVFTAGQTRTIPNAGTFTRLLPSYTVTAAGTLRLQCMDAGRTGEDITYLSPGGSLSVSRDMDIRGHADGGGLTSRCEGPDGVVLPRPPLLYPGDNSIKASAACTLRVWSTWT